MGTGGKWQCYSAGRSEGFPIQLLSDKPPAQLEEMSLPLNGYGREDLGDFWPNGRAVVLRRGPVSGAGGRGGRVGATFAKPFTP